MYNIILKEVLDKDGNIQLYDMFINNIWYGSRSTISSCEEFLLFCDIKKEK
jgi:hypothetical protein